MNKENQRYKLIESESNDWYCVPEERYDEARIILHPYDFRDKLSVEDFNRLEEQYCNGDTPDWMMGVSLYNLTFEKPERK